jgi:hypothetical protein
MKKIGGAFGAAKFREETSKKADSTVTDRIAATHNVGDRWWARKRFFAMQHCPPKDATAILNNGWQPFIKPR